MIKLYLSFIIASLLLISCGGSNIPDFGDDPEPEEETKTTSQISPLQRKYAAILGIPPKQATSVKLYEFIDSWEGTSYKMGGENRSGIDCSFFSQFLYHDVYNSLIERTAEKQFTAPSTNKFIGQEFLQEGDLLFFNLQGSEYNKVTHVGVYLGHNKFVHSTSNRTPQGNNGVQISNFKDRHWQKLFVAAGRKSNIK